MDENVRNKPTRWFGGFLQKREGGIERKFKGWGGGFGSFLVVFFSFFEEEYFI